jgi:hypothetical protein
MSGLIEIVEATFLVSTTRRHHAVFFPQLLTDRGVFANNESHGPAAR